MANAVRSVSFPSSGLQASQLRWCRVGAEALCPCQACAGLVCSRVASWRGSRSKLPCKNIPLFRCRQGYVRKRLCARGPIHVFCTRLGGVTQPTAMNPQLANFMLARTPEHILHPKTMADNTFTLNTGAKIPAVGLGTWQSGQSSSSTACHQRCSCVLTILKIQDRSRRPSLTPSRAGIDTSMLYDMSRKNRAPCANTPQAFVYGNENEVGEGLKEAFDSGIKVSELLQSPARKMPLRTGS